MSGPLLHVETVSLRFGGVQALEAVSFRLGKGELLGLIGPNGAGKTTLLRVITGLLRPSAGSVSLAGLEITALASHQRTHLGLALSQQLVRPFRAMSALDNVALAAGHRRTRRPIMAMLNRDRTAERDEARRLLALLGIEDAADARPDTLPLGVLKRVEMARALALEPAVLLLDEPLAGLNHLEAGRLADTIKDLNGQGLSIVLIEHNLGEVLRICDRLVVLDNGRKIADAAPRAVIADPAVRAAYLGAEDDDAAA
ncbi:MAG: ABC transporter ATP-binding protein [Pseudomonadota bacterium]